MTTELKSQLKAMLAKADMGEMNWEDDDVVDQIEQAFKDAGYMEPVTIVSPRFAIGKVTGTHYLTGQEWYERFTQEAHFIEHDINDVKAIQRRLYPYVMDGVNHA